MVDLLLDGIEKKLTGTQPFSGVYFKKHPCHVNNGQ